ncbi:hypothetical protein ACFV42_48125 [Streptomyces solisilvae]|uniref:hypothetical protein n=1 Tax=Streptomyces malaysiensis TaxID=92644 RepID=UPI0036955932
MTAGHRLAAARGFKITEKVVDPYGETNNPARRTGWRHLTELAAAGAFTRLITHLPSSISPDVECRYRATNALAEHGVRPLYSWPVQESHAGETVTTQ